MSMRYLILHMARKIPAQRIGENRGGRVFRDTCRGYAVPAGQAAQWFLTGMAVNSSTVIGPIADRRAHTKSRTQGAVDRGLHHSARDRACSVLRDPNGYTQG